MSAHMKSLIRWIIMGVFLVGSLWFAFRGIDIPRLMNAFSSMNYWIILTTVPINLLSHYIRGLRWRTMLKPIQQVSKTNAFSAVMVGYFFSNIIPRSGEIVRPFVFAKREKVSFTTMLATVFVERVLDGLSLVILVLFTFAQFRLQIIEAFPFLSETVVLAGLVLPVLVLIAGGLAVARTNFADWLLAKAVRPFSEDLYQKIEKQLHSFVGGFAVLSAPGQYIRITVETIAIWFLWLLPLYLGFFAFDLKVEHQFTLVDGLIVLVLQTLGFAFAPTPGGFGVVHSIGQLTLTKIYGVQPEIALAYASATHLAGYMTVIIFGGIAFIREHAIGLTFSQGTHLQEDILTEDK